MIAHLPAKPKHCSFCRALLVQRESERNDTYRKRLTCGGDCGRALTRQRWAEHPPIVRHARWVG